jgi:hypothetical protein
LQTILIKALLDAEKSLPGGSFRTVLPFSNELLDGARTILRLTLKRFGLGDGLPQEGDRV